MIADVDLLRTWVLRWCDRLADAFVTETVCDDGTRLVIALDPSLHLGVTTLVAQLPPAWQVPDDARDLFA